LFSCNFDPHQDLDRTSDTQIVLSNGIPPDSRRQFQQEIPTAKKSLRILF